MDTLHESEWDIVIQGTGLYPSLLSLTLSRSRKKILCVDPNPYYGGREAAFSLQDLESLSSRLENESNNGQSRMALSQLHFTKHSVEDDLVPPLKSRDYTLTFSPQIVHAQSKLVRQLVSSRAFRQLEFLAVGPLYVLQKIGQDGKAQDTSSDTTFSLVRIPATREELFQSKALKSASKRSLTKFLRVVMEDIGNKVERNNLTADTNTSDVEMPPPPALVASSDQAPRLFTEYLDGKMDEDVQTFLLALTLAPQYETLTVEEALSSIRRHVSSIGVYGAFPALYAEYGGGAEIAQVGCRAAAVGGATFVLQAKIDKHQILEPREEEAQKHQEYPQKLDISFPSPTSSHSDSTADLERATVYAKKVVTSSDVFSFPKEEAAETTLVHRAIFVVDSPLSSIFTETREGTMPAVALIVIPKQISCMPHPIYVQAHSSSTKECPVGQTVLYLSTLAGDETSARQLETGVLNYLLEALSSADHSETKVSPLLTLTYDSLISTSSQSPSSSLFVFPSAPTQFPHFQDSMLDVVEAAWKWAEDDVSDDEFMQFADREAVAESDEL